MSDIDKLIDAIEANADYAFDDNELRAFAEIRDTLAHLRAENKRLRGALERLDIYWSAHVNDAKQMAGAARAAPAKGAAMTDLEDLIERLRTSGMLDCLDAAERLTRMQEAWMVERSAAIEARAENERLRNLLQWLDRKGGLGLDVHDRIRAVLKVDE